MKSEDNPWMLKTILLGKLVAWIFLLLSVVVIIVILPQGFIGGAQCLKDESAASGNLLI